MKGVDYSFARPGGAAIKAAGFEFCVRYIPYLGDGGKGLTADELADLRANDLAVCLVFESTEGRMLEGYAAGQADAQISQACQANLGLTGPVYFACDFDAQPQQFPALDEYLRGTASVLGADNVGVYGGYQVIEHCAQTDTARWRWQTYAWSYGEISQYAHFRQYLNGQEINGGAVDLNEAYVPDIGQWPRPTLQEDPDMATLAELEARVAALEEFGRGLNAAIAARVDLLEVASGPWDRMMAAWQALKDASLLKPGDAP